MADEVEDVRMVAQGAAHEAGIALLQLLHLAEARLRIALPREGPHGRERDVRHLDGLDLPDRAFGDQFLQAADDGVVVHLEFDLADDARLVAHLDHLVVFVHVERRNLHREDVDALLGAPLHLLEVTVVRGRDDNGLDVGVLAVHLLGVEVARHARLVELVCLPGIFILRTGRDPVELLVVHQCLIVFSRMTMCHTQHGNLDRFHSF